MSNVLKRYFSNCSIRAFILRISLLFSVLGFLIIYLGASQAYDSALRDSSRAIADSRAELIFDDLTAAMDRGISRAEMASLLQQINQGDGNSALQVRLFRSELIEQDIGYSQGPEPDSFVLRSLLAGTRLHSFEQDQVRYSYPLKASQQCIQCHRQVNEGEVLGVLEIRQDLGPMLAGARSELLTNLLWLAPIPLLLAIWVVRLLNRRINRSVVLLEQRIDQVQSLSDLSQLKFDRSELGFTDLQRIFSKFERLTDKTRAIAVDKELLEFEIRLLERFVITSEVIQGWHYHVCELLQEINQVLNASNLFSIFKVDDEVLGLEIFWLQPPTPQTRERLEREIRQNLSQSPHFHEAALLEVNHHVANESAEPVELALEDIRFQTKSLLLETPKLGGIVGIGVHSDVVADQTRMLVTESILSTMLNVVGSVKAIYKYTRDMEYYATRDSLTDLYNQRMFWELMDNEISRCKRDRSKVALLVLDLDNFKSINDAYGNGFGDQCLQQVAQTIKSVLRTEDILSRYAGDRYTVVLPGDDMQQSQHVANRILEAVNELEMTASGDQSVRSSVSIGTAVYPDHAHNSRDLLMFGENIMRKAKREGKNRACVPSNEDVLETFKELNQKSRIILSAIENKQITPFFQPIMGLQGRKIEAVEVLSRIRLEDGGLMGAHEFIEVAESMGLIHSLDLVVIERALQQVQDEGFPGLVFINLSPSSLVMSEFLPQIRELTRQTGIDPGRIVFEMTERDTVKNLALLERFVKHLKSAGFKLAVDDFGSGFSSFHYLKHFPIDYVKIEGEFVSNMINSERDASVVRCIAQLAKDLGARTVAEFIEDDAVLQAVGEINIDLGQGYHIGRPQSRIYADSNPALTAMLPESKHAEATSGTEVEQT
ncbi:bifunctional diguanylate cyclase/phosphodiesterase [Motiliproteus coralliicola]|uniref:Bifunctional diguanylate cyclase/phosphodiesterase n=1 Tax=Motiliproteus coralliicola TaxID=2283196 RepID=A0A369W849_9GAMM|nr:bifunctional diguanylate cyclase/phosphodiesterase [Motiliproteus coralliicola]RDE18092.1 bifunctional diguanylate cyclase/phosphodiesterase [Motiliproteus coralliicola]